MKVLILFLCMQIFGLDRAAEYARQHPEYPPIENENVLQPRYKNFHKGMKATGLGRFFEWLGFRKPLWSAQQFSSLIETVCQRPKESVVTLVLPAGTEIIIIGPLFGAYHSLVRLLEEFKRKGILDDSLRVKSDYYIIFNGNVIDGSPYILETLTLVLTLMKQNPNVIYLQGKHEHAGYWLNHGLKHELQERISSGEVIKEQLLACFNRLPKAVDIVGTGKEIIRVTSGESSSNNLVALIRAEDRLIDYGVHSGLALLQSEAGTTAWSVFSAPTRLYKDYFNFYYDSFTILTVAEPLTDSILNLYNRDVRTDKPFEKVESYNVVSGQRLVEGVKLIKPTEENTITLGSTMDLSRSIKSIGINVRAGLSAAINRINRLGGIHNKIFKLVVFDDQYLPTLARKNMERINGFL